MLTYADTSFLARLYTLQADSEQALKIMARLKEPLCFTPLHRYELRNAVRLCRFRGYITPEQRNQAFRDIESDLSDNILSHVPIVWTDAFREAERLGEVHTETLGVRSIDLLHVALAVTLNRRNFLTFDQRQKQLAVAAGLTVPL